MLGHEHYIECCAFAPPASYNYLAPLAGLKKAPPSDSLAEFMASGSRDKNIKLWDSRGVNFKTLQGHDSWVRAIVFHPGGKYLLSVSDDKTLRCWDLSQDGRCSKVIEGSHDGFISCLKWAPPVRVDHSTESHLIGASNGDPPGANAAATRIRSVLATGGVDYKLRIFAN